MFTAPTLFFTIRSASGPYHTHIPPIDTSTPYLWAEGIVEQLRAVTTHGFGNCHDGTPYDAENFAADQAGTFPPYRRTRNEIIRYLLEHPEFSLLRAKFKEQNGFDCWEGIQEDIE